MYPNPPKGYASSVAGAPHHRVSTLFPQPSSSEALS
jgi:hypothetical protein